ncbi:hypothetical protein HC928_22340 [bacterium]|nr:hypothetical protein [bacterium]
MPELLTVNDSTLESVINNAKPVLLLVSNGEGLRGDFSTAFKKAAAEATALSSRRSTHATTPKPPNASAWGINPC